MRDSKLVRGIVLGWVGWTVGRCYAQSGCNECLTRLVWGMRA